MTPSQIALTLEIVAYMPVGITVVPLGCISDMKYKERVSKETRQNLTSESQKKDAKRSTEGSRLMLLLGPGKKPH